MPDRSFFLQSLRDSNSLYHFGHDALEAVAHPVGMSFDELEPELDLVDRGRTWLTWLASVACRRSLPSGPAICHEYLDGSAQLSITWLFVLPCLLRRPSSGRDWRPIVADPRQVKVLPSRTSVAQHRAARRSQRRAKTCRRGGRSRQGDQRHLAGDAKLLDRLVEMLKRNEEPTGILVNDRDQLVRLA